MDWNNVAMRGVALKTMKGITLINLLKINVISLDFH